MCDFEWHLIATAPMDTKSRLVWCPEYQNIYIVTWDKYSGRWHHFSSMNEKLEEYPTHWAPLPSPPPREKEAPDV